MLTLTTILAISIIGVAFVLGFKHFEIKGGKRMFLPDSWYDEDDAIERHTQYLGKKVLWWAKHRAKQVSHHAVTGSLVVVERIKNRRDIARSKHSLLKNGSGSTFLRQANEHKNRIRRENGYHEE